MNKLGALICGLALAGCYVGPTAAGGPGGPPPPTIADDQVGGTCPPPGNTNLVGGGVTGEACFQADTDCAPICCSCSNGDGFQFLAADCEGGACADPNTTCLDIESADPTLCP